MKKIICLLVLVSQCGYVLSQMKQPTYVNPTDPAVLEQLKWWQGLKFGLLMHWGPYSEWGVVESWSICPEDEGWTQRKGHRSASYFDYRTNYENLLKTFNPVKFNPAKWAAAAGYAGMRYLVFTTKHHDGFCMFDTRGTDYKITSDSCPFHADSRANVTRVLFEAFRKQGFGIGAYFSKPDWHSQDFWWSYFPPLDRFPNYDEAKYPDRWQRFRDFTYNQIRELMSGEYGKIDILWLDGGWVRPHSAEEIRENLRQNDDIDMPAIASMARSLQPGILLVDRDVPGPYENYRTPEQQVPAAPLPYPWETCMTMGNSWSYVPGDHYKSVHELVQLLLRIVSRGGNFLLNIGPGPDGDLDPVAYQRLKGIGDWMKLNSSAIYNSVVYPPYESGKIVYTQSSDNHTVYACYLADSAESGLPSSILIIEVHPGRTGKIYLLGYNRPLPWNYEGTGIRIHLPENLRDNPPCPDAWIFRIPGQP